MHHQGLFNRLVVHLLHREDSITKITIIIIIIADQSRSGRQFDLPVRLATTETTIDEIADIIMNETDNGSHRPETTNRHHNTTNLVEEYKFRSSNRFEPRIKMNHAIAMTLVVTATICHDGAIVTMMISRKVTLTIAAAATSVGITEAAMEDHRHDVHGAEAQVVNAIVASEGDAVGRRHHLLLVPPRTRRTLLHLLPQDQAKVKVAVQIFIAINLRLNVSARIYKETAYITTKGIYFKRLHIC
jgi:hypothetical protein